MGSACPFDAIPKHLRIHCMKMGIWLSKIDTMFLCTRYGYMADQHDKNFTCLEVHDACLEEAVKQAFVDKLCDYLRYLDTYTEVKSYPRNGINNVMGLMSWINEPFVPGHTPALQTGLLYSQKLQILNAAFAGFRKIVYTTSNGTFLSKVHQRVCRELKDILKYDRDDIPYTWKELDAHVKNHLAWVPPRSPSHSMSCPSSPHPA